MKQLGEEKGLSVTGGILAGETWLTSRSFTWPLVRCTISGDGITLTTSCPPRFHFYIPKQSISQVVLKNYRIAAGIRIIHDSQEVPRYIHFGTFAVSDLKQALEHFHYV